MSLYQELSWRGFINQTTIKDLNSLDKKKYTLYFGVDPSADSLTIGNLASLILVDHFIKKNHQAFLLVGGATGLIGDPDGKDSKRALKPRSEIVYNKKKIALQFKSILKQNNIKVLDNYDWFKDINYIEFLREIGYNIPLRTMLSRQFVKDRLDEGDEGISYGEFSYSLIQGYDFYHLNKKYAVNLQLCGSDQWGNAIAGVDIIRRLSNFEADVLSMPLIINKVTGKKFGKSEEGAIWLDEQKTSITSFYQFWINVDDINVFDYLKIYTFLSKDEFEDIKIKHLKDPKLRIAQKELAKIVTIYVHGEDKYKIAKNVTEYLTNQKKIDQISSQEIKELSTQIKTYHLRSKSIPLIDLIVNLNLASSRSEAKQLIKDKGIYLNNLNFTQEEVSIKDLENGFGLLRKGKSFKDSGLIFS